MLIMAQVKIDIVEALKASKLVDLLKKATQGLDLGIILADPPQQAYNLGDESLKAPHPTLMVELYEAVAEAFKEHESWFFAGFLPETCVWPPVGLPKANHMMLQLHPVCCHSCG